MTKPSPDTHVDPELHRQLAVSTPDRPVSAVYTLRTPAGQKYLPAAETQTTVDKLLNDLPQALRSAVGRLKVYANTQSFALEAPPPVVEQLLQRHEIAAAMADRQPESLLIRPVPDADIAGGSEPNSSPD